ncbi:MAG: fused MFS/spermidine synthase, partial [Planctomycetaceae bacterium]|nr:fused MFS/spermidine synthase [Planctomycetaceae bacterium]
VALLAGYAYAHAATRWLPIAGQIVTQLAVVGIAFVALPIAIPSDSLPPVDSNPAPWLLGTLLLRVGAPFFALAATAPLLQRWFGMTSHRSAADPYFLYALSNLGSLAALLGYPFVIEPNWGLAEQSRFWAIGFAAFGACTLLAALTVWRRPVPVRGGEKAAAELPAQPAPSLPDSVRWRERFYWLGLAAIPTSWMLAVTTRLTTDLSPVPLLWILPLSIYLLTYIVAFSPWGAQWHPLVQSLFPISIIALAVSLLFPGHWYLLGIDLAVFAIGALACHMELARRRPPVERLTEFYLWLSLGGAVGGTLNALVAPLLFTTVLEYPITVGLACLLLPALGRAADPITRLAWLGGTTVVLGLMLRGFPLTAPRHEIYLALVVIAALAAIFWSGRTRWFAPLILALLAFDQTVLHMPGELLARHRSFFGIHYVTRDLPERPERFLRLFHGTTLHGLQHILPERGCEPIGYYTRQGPLGDIFAAVPPRPGAVQQVAVVGLGTGGAACYAGPERFITFYEIDPAVLALANEYFSHLSVCGRENSEVVLGDGRLQLASAPDHKYQIIWLDAFSSDAIPVHLLTREALELYLQKLDPRGVLVFHISNKYLDLAGVLADLAGSLGLEARVRTDSDLTKADLAAGKAPSRYLVLARNAADVGNLARSPQWKLLVPRPAERLWTDDYSNVLGVLKADVAEQANAESVTTAGE